MDWVDNEKTGLSAGALIGTLVPSMNRGGRIQVIGVVGATGEANLSQDLSTGWPADEFERVIGQLLEIVKPKISQSAFEQSQIAADELRREYESEHPSERILKRLAGTLSLLGDAEGNIALAICIGPLVTQLLVMALDRVPYERGPMVSMLIIPDWEGSEGDEG